MRFSYKLKEEDYGITPRHFCTSLLSLFMVLCIFANLLLHVHEVFLNFMPATSNTYTY